ncbi:MULTISPECIES: right-handed parallel beta-helix repeat-containing protein [unclassified Paenibacillus]|uniref:right-handed parallel beta-helix repeat-containing protein n=1 Tax=unclassified Paenibacillus TaxID=185978 RepID=UPI00363CCB5E
MAVIRVPLDQSTIQSGVNAAQPGDVVLVHRGVYKEVVHVTSSSIRIVADDKYEAVLEGGSLLSNGFILDNTSDVEICGFKIKNYIQTGIFVHDGGCHRLLENSCEMNGLHGIGLNSTNNFIWKNKITTNTFGGISVYGSNNWIVDNGLSANGFDGVTIYNGSHNAMMNNVTFSQINGSGFYILGPNTLMYENELKNNRWGIVIHPTAIVNSPIADNNEATYNKLKDIVILSDSDNSETNHKETTAPMSSTDKYVQFINYVNDQLAMIQQSLDLVPDQQRPSQEMSLMIFRLYRDKLQPPL